MSKQKLLVILSIIFFAGCATVQPQPKVSNLNRATLRVQSPFILKSINQNDCYRKSKTLLGSVEYWVNPQINELRFTAKKFENIYEGQFLVDFKPGHKYVLMEKKKAKTGLPIPVLVDYTMFRAERVFE